MKKYLRWIFVFMASLTAVSAYADGNRSNDSDQEEVAIGSDVDTDFDDENIEEVEE